MYNKMATDTIKAEDYTLDRNYLASCRLTGQHPLYIERNGCHLCPEIVTHLRNAVREGIPTAIADMGCGNTVWTRDIAEQHPEAEVFGYDISPAQYPPSSLVPKNMKLAVADLYAKDVPEDMKGKFDVIHVRLVRIVAPGIDAVKVERTFRNFLQMLKPAGFVQWEDTVFPFFDTHDPTSIDILTPIQPYEMDNHWSLIDQALGGYSRKWRDWDWVAAMRQAGFDEVEATKLPVLRSTLHFESSYIRWVLQEFIETCRKKVGDEARKLLDQSEVEMNQLIKDGYLLSVVMSRYVGIKRSS